MTDTGQVPAEGLPESAGMVEQPGASAAHGSYTYLSENTVEDEDLLLPGSQGAWGNEVAPPAPEPLVEAVHEPDAHEISGRDSGSVDLSAVRLPGPSAPSTPIPPITPRRPLHLGPPIPDASASPVRSLADRGAVGAPVRQPGQAPVGPEYLDVPQPLGTPAPQSAPWGAPAQTLAPVTTEAPAAETVVPAGQPVGVAQAVVDRVATEAVTESGAAQDGEVAVPAPQEGAYGGAELSVEVAEASAPEADPSVAALPATEAAEGAVPDAEAGAPAEDLPVNEADSGAGQVAGVGDGPEDGQGAEPGPAPGDAADEAAPPPVAEAAQVSEEPAAEVDDQPSEGSAPEAVQAAEAAQAPDAAAEAAQVSEEPEAEVGPVSEGATPETAVPEASEAAQPPVGPEPDVARLPEAPAAETEAVAAVPAPEAEPIPGAPAPEAAPVPDAVAPEASAQVAEPAAAEVPQAPEAAHFPEAAQPLEAAPFPEAAQDPEALAPADHQPMPEAAAVPPAPDAAQVTEPAEPEPLPPTAQPTDAVAVPADAASAVVAPEAAPHPADTEQPAQQAVEPAVPLAQPAEDPQQAQAPEAIADPHLPQAEQPGEHAAPADLGAETQEAAVSAPLPDEEAPVADPAAEIQDAERAPDAAVEPAVPAQPLVAAAAPDSADPRPAEPAPADAPEPFVAEPAGPQLRSVAEPAQVLADAVQPPVGPAEPGQGETAAVFAVGIPQEQAPEQPLGQFVPVEGSVPTTPHLAPTPPQPIVLPAEEASVATVPAPREGDPALVQHAEDLDTRAADQEDPQEPATPEEESTAAVEEVRQPTGPAAPAYDEAEREAVLKVMRERRDIRNGFRGDPIPHEVLLRVLEAAHTAPSVGHSQPWDFVVIRSADTRRTMHELAMRQRDAYAKSLPKGRAKQFKELKIEAILDTPVNIVVTADPTRGGRHTLGRHTQPQMAPYSAALAVENLWLAARAEGLGVGWVSFFDEREMVRALGLPEHLEVIAYLCVGYVDEFPDEPELMQAGWSKRRPLSWVVHEETYGRRALPGEEPHDLLAETVAQIRPLDAKALGEAWERQKRMTKPPGSLGMLEIISAQLSGLSRQCPPPIPEPAAVAIFAGDHGVHAQGVTPWPQEVTAQMVANFLGGGAVCNAFAGQVGAEVCVVDVGVAADLPATPGLLPRKVRAGTSDMTTGPAMTREEAKQAIEVGIETARDLVAAGNKALLTGEMGIANTTASAALISVYTDTDPAEVTGRGTGINDETLARKTEVVRRAIEFHQPDPADPIGVLAAIGGFEHAAIVGLLLGGASLRTPVILDGVSAGAAALVARAIAPEVLAACIAGHRSAEPGHVAALNKLGLRPLVDLDLRLGEGTGALLALPLVQSTARAMHEVATFDSAGVTEK
ncbi:nicotinate-nucleotide--dimethylbenzimidazole phosphoribosyltransferase [Streptomyces sp. NPDC057623]|uniref:nicotinate-nucleotide--dimethylbenzimidazole phosphoribosyltransferase n=1 Tax=Streptomyces sp. NPDC057623 TaxID=3346187 RepID=UPI003684C4A7